MFRNRPVFVVFAVMMLLSSCNVFAQRDLKERSVGMRWGLWNLGNDSNLITYIEFDDGTEFIRTGGFGGWLFFRTRTSRDWLFELGFGAFAQAEDIESRGYYEEEINAKVIIPVLFGMQRGFPFSEHLNSLEPYVAFGAGPYWITDIMEREFFGTDKVTSRIQFGAYAGGGLNYYLGSSFSLNLDVRYHAIDLNFDNDLSGLEYGVGFAIHWGSFGNTGDRPQH